MIRGMRRKKKRKVIDSAADSRVRLGGFMLLIVAGLLIVWGVHFILFTPVGR